MEPLNALLAGGARASERRVQAFRATDAFAVEAYRATRLLREAEEGSLAGEIRRTVVRSGGALVAASAAPPGGEDERSRLEVARVALVEGRYYLYLATRLGFLDLRRYRALVARQDAALRAVESLLAPAGSATSGRPP